MMRAEFISMPRMTALVLAVLLAAGSLSGCSSMESEAAQMPAGEMQSSAISVQVTYAEYGSIDRNSEFAGKIEAARTIKVYAPTQAQVTQTYASVGQTVSEGDLLFTLDTEDLQEQVDSAYLQYQSALNSADSSLLNAEKSYNSSAQSYQTASDNLEDLEDEYEDQLDTLRSEKNQAKTAWENAQQALADAEAAGEDTSDEKAAVDAAKEAYDDAISDYNSLYNEYERLEETYKTQKSNARDDMEYARESYELVTGGEDGEGSASYTIQQALNTYEAAVEALENANVTAPVSGTIVSKSVEESDMASPTTAAYVIQTDGEQVVSFDVSAEAASALSLGDEVTIIYGGNEYAAVVTELSVQADETTGLFSVTAQPLEDLGTDRTGIAVKVRASTAKAEETLLLDIDLVEYDENQPYVYVYENGTAVRHDIEIGITSKDTVSVISGITAEDAIISTWHPDLKDGASVTCEELEQSAAAEQPGEDSAAETPDGEGEAAPETSPEAGDAALTAPSEQKEAQ